MQDKTFQAYPPFGELFAYYFELKDAEGGNRIETMNNVKDEFNIVMKKIFPNYTIIAEWNERPKITIQKNDSFLTLDQLSLGEQEMLSLLFNLYISRDQFDIFLIDEPEAHLNWSLEVSLFKFLNWFCETYNKQIITATHARVIFTDEFYPKAQFLLWEGNKVVCRPEITEVQKAAIAGQAIELVKIVKLSKKTFFAEDGMHQNFLEILALVKGRDISVVACGNKAAVKSLYKFAKTNPEYSDAHFMIDGDNEGSPFPGEQQFIFLQKYCLECYFVNVELLCQVFSDTTENIKHHIIDIIKAKKHIILKQNKFLEFLVDRITPSDINDDLLAKFDCSEILSGLISQYAIPEKEFIHQYIARAIQLGTIASIFPQEIITAVDAAGETLVLPTPAIDAAPVETV